MIVGVGSRHICGSFLEVIEHQGWRGLWAGNAVNMLRIVPTQAIELATFEYVKRAMTSVQENWKQSDRPNVQVGHVSLNISLSWLSPIALAGAAAGVVSTLVCHPLEVLKVYLSICCSLIESEVFLANLSKCIFQFSSITGTYTLLQLHTCSCFAVGLVYWV